jgi:recombination protein RecA
MKINDEKIFNDVIKQIKTQFGKGCITTFNGENETIDVIPTGSIHLDRALGVGGIPKGRIIEIFGNESSGKTTLALQIVAQCQKNNGKCAYIDLEHALDSTYCKVNNVNVGELLLAQPDSGEQAFSIIEELIKTNLIDLIVVDSVAALVPEAELTGEMTEQSIGLQARLMSKGLRICQGLMCKNQKTTIIFINQIREKIGISFGNNEITTGGRALRFYSSVRIEMRRSELLKKDDECVGIKTCAKVIKNKVAPPLAKAYIEIYFDRGIDHTLEIIDFSLEKGIIEKKGS